MGVSTNDVESSQSEESQHVQGFREIVLYAIEQPLDVLEDEWFCIEQIGLRESMAEKPPSLAMKGPVPQAEYSQTMLAHRFVNWSLDKACLLAVYLLDGFIL